MTYQEELDKQMVLTSAWSGPMLVLAVIIFVPFVLLLGAASVYEMVRPPKDCYGRRI